MRPHRTKNRLRTPQNLCKCAKDDYSPQSPPREPEQRPQEHPRAPQEYPRAAQEHPTMLKRGVERGEEGIRSQVLPGTDSHSDTDSASGLSSAHGCGLRWGYLAPKVPQIKCNRPMPCGSLGSGKICETIRATILLAGCPDPASTHH